MYLLRIKVLNEDNRDTLQTNFNQDIADSYSPPVVENMDASDSQKNKVTEDIISKFFIIV